MDFIKVCCLTALGAALPGFGWVGCRRPAPAAVQRLNRLELRAQADPVINRDPEGNPLSVVVHLYQLRDRGGFERLGFDAAASGRTEAELLGADGLGRTELVVVPGGRHAATQELLPGTRFLGIVALFRQPDPHYWRYLVSLDRMAAGQPRPTGKKPVPPVIPALSFQVRECALALPELTPEPIPGQPEDGLPSCPGAGAPAGPRP